jgi:sugar lactone lactonase YvrE
MALLAAPVLAQAPEGGAPPAAPTWTLTTGFRAPESAYHDPASGHVFVSSINGQILEKDGNGYISRLSPDGEMLEEMWVTGLDAPKGMRSTGGTLWVSDIDRVVSIDIASATITARVPVEGAVFLNDLATAPDGTVYVSDSSQSRIYMVRDGRSSVFVEGAEFVEQANGLLVDGSRLVLGTIGPAALAGRGGRGRVRGAPAGGHLFAFDLATRERTQLTTEPVGGIDGIEPDGRGGLLVTDVFGRRLLHVAPSGQVRTLVQFDGGGADFGYVPSRRLAIVPFLNEHRVAAYDLTSLLP